MRVSERTTLSIPPLESGDRLTRAEFERRYIAMPHVKKAELIDRTVYMSSPVRVHLHAQPHAYVMAWLATYVAATPYLVLGDSTTVRLDPDNEIQPDALLRIEERSGGQSRVSEDNYVEGAPELIVEVAASSAAYDLHDKKAVCRRHGVREYVVWQVLDDRLDWFVLEDDAFLRLAPDDDGLLRSRTFPGLLLNVEALLEGNLAVVLDTVRAGAEGKEHTTFVQQLGEAREAE